MTLPPGRTNPTASQLLRHQGLAFGHHGQASPRCVTWGGFASSKGDPCLGNRGMNVSFDCSSLLKRLPRTKLPSQNQTG